MKREAHRLGEAIVSKDALAITLAVIPLLLLVAQTILREIDAVEASQRHVEG